MDFGDNYYNMWEMISKSRGIRIPKYIQFAKHFYDLGFDITIRKHRRCPEDRIVQVNGEWNMVKIRFSTEELNPENHEEKDHNIRVAFMGNRDWCLTEIIKAVEYEFSPAMFEDKDEMRRREIRDMQPIRNTRYDS